MNNFLKQTQWDRMLGSQILSVYTSPGEYADCTCYNLIQNENLI